VSFFLIFFFIFFRISEAEMLMIILSCPSIRFMICRKVNGGLGGMLPLISANTSLINVMKARAVVTSSGGSPVVASLTPPSPGGGISSPGAASAMHNGSGSYFRPARLPPLPEQE
jgi:hypothetical protein